MAEIEFGPSDAVALGVIKSFVRQINGDFYGKDGVMQEFKEFVNVLKGEQQERERMHQQNSAKLDKVNTRIMLGSLIVGVPTMILGVAEIVHIMKH